MQTPRLKKGFTIVELLIVIVVIGILSAIVIVGYSVVIKNAADASLKTDLNKVSDTLESESFDSGYPGSLSAINNGAGPTVSMGTVLQYTGSGTSYCITAFSQKANGPFYKKSGGGSVQSGMCPGHYNPFLPAPVLTWTTITPAGGHNRSGIASSSDGTRVAIGDAQYSPGYVFTSINSGGTWTPNDLGAPAGGGSFGPVRMSADGSVIATFNSYSAKLYVSINSGATWTQRTATPAISLGSTLAMSSDGQKMAIASATGIIYTSNDAGVTWASRYSVSAAVSSLVMSNDGTRIAASTTDSQFLSSSNSGATWAYATSPGVSFLAMDASSTAATIVASTGSSGASGFIYVSTDYGATWTKQTSVGAGYWQSVGISDAGTTMLVGADNFSGTVQLSTNGGSLWTQQTSFGTYPMARAISVAGDGHTLYIAGGSGGISYKASL